MVTMANVPLITLDAATPFERGVQYGQQAKAKIEIAVEYYKKKFAAKFTWDQVLAYAEKFNEETKKFSPEIFAELEGIASGSGFDIREIMAVNARYEISQFNWQKECTTGVFLDEKRKKYFIFKNCDLGLGVSNHLVILHISKPDGYRAIGVAEAGQLVRDGYNNAGLGMVNSALRSHLDYAGVGVPGTVVRKKIWESTDFEEACNVQRKLFRTVSTNMLLACKEGKALDFECYPGGQDEVLPDNGIIGTGNRFTVDPSKNRAIDPNIDRGLRMRALLKEHRNDPITEQTIMNLLKDHEGHPESICRHAEDVGHCTVYSIVINMTDDKVYICEGNPCQNEYREYPL